MKKIILGALLTAGAVLAQSTGTAPANNGAKSGTSTSGTATSGTATNGSTPAKKHRKSNKPAAATKSGTSSSNASGSKAPANSGTPANK